MGITEEAIHVIEDYQKKNKEFKREIENFKKIVQDKYIKKEPFLQTNFFDEFEELKANIDEIILSEEKFLKFYEDFLVLKKTDRRNNEVISQVRDYNIKSAIALENADKNFRNLFEKLERYDQYIDLYNYLVRVHTKLLHFLEFSDKIFHSILPLLESSIKEEETFKKVLKK